MKRISLSKCSFRPVLVYLQMSLLLYITLCVYSLSKTKSQTTCHSHIHNKVAQLFREIIWVNSRGVHFERFNVVSVSFCHNRVTRVAQSLFILRCCLWFKLPTLEDGVMFCYNLLRCSARNSKIVYLRYYYSLFSNHSFEE